MAPKNVIQTNNHLDNSSDSVIPELKPYRKKTLPKTKITMTAMKAAMRYSIALQVKSKNRVIGRVL
jgi:hypothetical protein